MLLVAAPALKTRDGSEAFQVVAVGPGLSLPPRLQRGFVLQRFLVGDQKDVGTKKDSILVFDKEVADRIGVVAVPVKEPQPGGTLHGQIGKSIQQLPQFVQIVRETGEVRRNEVRLRVFLQQIVSLLDQPFPARHRGMLIVSGRVALLVLECIIRVRISIFPQIGGMDQHRQAQLTAPRPKRIAARIINLQQRSGRVAMMHSQVLPDLDSLHAQPRAGLELGHNLLEKRAIWYQGAWADGRRAALQSHSPGPPKS